MYITTNFIYKIFIQDYKFNKPQFHYSNPKSKENLNMILLCKIHISFAIIYCKGNHNKFKCTR